MANQVPWPKPYRAEPRQLTEDEIELSRRIQEEEHVRQGRVLFFWAFVTFALGVGLSWFA